MKVLILYFSATGNTSKIAKAIEEKFTELGVEVSMSDITPYTERQGETDLEPYQAVVFGAPIHSRRAPGIVREWLRTLDGKGKKCAMFFTYGGFGIHPIHYSTRKILREQNFVVVSSAEFPSAHTSNIGGWEALEERPDIYDFETAKEYALKTYKRFIGKDKAILEELPQSEYSDAQLDGMENLRFNIVSRLPSRNGKECGLCMTCEELCPAGAMNAEEGRAEKRKCIACLACVKRCPENVLEINDLSGFWNLKMKPEKNDEEKFRRQKSKIYM